MGKAPAFQFYPGDWIRDPVSGCSLAAQGLWLRMIIIMHDSERYGCLCSNGGPMPAEAIARRCGCTPEEYNILYSELEKAGVPRKNSAEIVFSKRMVNDKKRRKKWSRSKQKQRENLNVHPPVLSNVPAKSPGSSISSVSSIPSVERQKTVDTFEKRFWPVWKKKIAKQEALKAWVRLKPNEPLIEKIVADVQRRFTSLDWTKDRMRFAPYAATYLNNKRWEDEEPKLARDATGEVNPLSRQRVSKADFLKDWKKKEDE